MSTTTTSTAVDPAPADFHGGVIEDAETIKVTLKAWAQQYPPPLLQQQVTLSEDGRFLTYHNNHSDDATTNTTTQTCAAHVVLSIASDNNNSHKLSSSSSSSSSPFCQYTAASIFLQIRDPQQGLLPYRSICKKHQVQDPIKALDKPLILSYFLQDYWQALMPHHHDQVEVAVVDAAAAAESQPESQPPALPATTLGESTATAMDVEPFEQQPHPHPHPQYDEQERLFSSQQSQEGMERGNELLFESTSKLLPGEEHGEQAQQHEGAIIGTTVTDGATAAAADSQDTTAPVASKKSSSSSSHHHKDRRDSSKSKDHHHHHHHNNNKHRGHHHHHDSKHPRSEKESKEHRHRHGSSSGSKRPHHADGTGSSSHSKRHKSSGGSSSSSKPMTNEQLFSNLNVVVDKRQQQQQTTTTSTGTIPSTFSSSSTSTTITKEQAEALAIQKALSAEGFQVTLDLLAQYQEQSQWIASHEIPVGNSASILRATAGRDLKRVLELFNEAMINTTSGGTTPGSKGSHKAGSSSSKSKTSLPMTPTTAGAGAATPPGTKPINRYLIGKRPIIIVPKGMSAPITMVNAHEFFANAKFVPRDVMIKQQQQQQQQQGGRRGPPPHLFTRRISPRWLSAAKSGTTTTTATMLASSSSSNTMGLLEFELMDNPTSKLGVDNVREWQRIVAVVCLGQAWQFKDWPGPYGKAVSLFGGGQEQQATGSSGSGVYGCYLGLEGDSIPNELLQWNVKKSKLSRDKRSLDTVTHANFWNDLEEWMAIHKPELLPSSTSSSATPLSSMGGGGT